MKISPHQRFISLAKYYMNPAFDVVDYKSGLKSVYGFRSSALKWTEECSINVVKHQIIGEGKIGKFWD